MIENNDDQQLDESLSLEFANAVRAIASLQAPASSIERTKKLATALEAKQTSVVTVPSTNGPRRRVPIAVVCLAMVGLLLVVMGGMYFAAPVRDFITFNRIEQLEVHRVEKTMSEGDIRAEGLSIAAASVDTKPGLGAAFYVANHWPATPEAESSRQLAIQATKTLSTDELADGLGYGGPWDGQLEYWGDFAMALRGVVDREPEHPRAGRLLASIARIYEPGRNAEVASDEFVEIADLIQEQYANSPDLANFCEIFRGSCGAKWASAFEPHLRSIMKVNQDRFVRLTAHFALASVVRAGGDERRADARQLYKDFLVQFDGKSNYSTRQIEAVYRRESAKILKTL